MIFSANPAQAASLTYNWSFSGLSSTFGEFSPIVSGSGTQTSISIGGTLVADASTGIVSSISGYVGNQRITGLAPGGVNKIAIPGLASGVYKIPIPGVDLPNGEYTILSFLTQDDSHNVRYHDREWSIQYYSNPAFSLDSRFQEGSLGKPSGSYLLTYSEKIWGMSGFVSKPPSLNGWRGNYAVPEPLTILGSITAAGFGVAFKRKLAKSKKDQEDA